MGVVRFFKWVRHTGIPNQNIAWIAVKTGRAAKQEDEATGALVQGVEGALLE